MFRIKCETILFIRVRILLGLEKAHHFPDLFAHVKGLSARLDYPVYLKTAVREVLKTLARGPVNVARHLEQMLRLLHENGFKPRFEKMTFLVSAAVEVFGVKGIEIMHDLGDRHVIARLDEELNFIGFQTIG